MAASASQAASPGSPAQPYAAVARRSSAPHRPPARASAASPARAPAAGSSALGPHGPRSFLAWPARQAKVAWIPLRERTSRDVRGIENVALTGHLLVPCGRVRATRPANETKNEVITSKTCCSNSRICRWATSRSSCKRALCLKRHGKGPETTRSEPQAAAEATSLALSPHRMSSCLNLWPTILDKARSYLT